MSGAAAAMLLAGGPFQPVNHIYGAGSGTETIPAGATQMIIEVGAAGGGGGTGDTFGAGADGYGGASGAYTTKTYAALTSADWGKTLNWSCGAGGTGQAPSHTPNSTVGGDSTVSNGTWGTAVALVAHGGGRGSYATGWGVGQSATGGTTNINGQDGSHLTTNGGPSNVGGYASSGKGGDGQVAGAGLYGTNGNDGAIAFEYT